MEANVRKVVDIEHLSDCCIPIEVIFGSPETRADDLAEVAEVIENRASTPQFVDLSYSVQYGKNCKLVRGVRGRLGLQKAPTNSKVSGSWKDWKLSSLQRINAEIIPSIIKWCSV